MKFVISGGTGFIGGALLERSIAEKHSILLLTRKPKALSDLEKIYVEVAQWDGRTLGKWVQRMEGADAVINLAGESLGDGRWTNKRKDRIMNSRLVSTKVLVDAIAQLKQKPSVFVSASGVGYYGNVESGDVSESHPNGNDFLAKLCLQWEQAATKAEELGVRVVKLRNGIVLAGDGGALKKMMIPFKMFAGGTIGSGKQWLPWIHREDVMRIIFYAINNHQLSGAVNVVAPDQVTMKQFCKTLGMVMHRPAWLQVPAFVMKSILGEMSEMVLTGQRAVSKRLQDAGFKFQYPTLEGALRAIFQ